MQQSIKNVLFPMTLFVLIASSLVAQDKVQITGTSLKMALPEGFTVDENSATVSSDAYIFNIIEMAGVDFDTQISNFENIEEKYAVKNITLKKKEKGKLSSYEALFLLLETEPSMYQIFFGNNEFCAMVNVIATDMVTPIDESEVKKIFNSVEFEASKGSALEQHANFTFTSENSDWEFMTYAANTFSFSNTVSEDATMIVQFPPEALTLSTKENMANELLNKFKAEIPDIKVIEKGDWKINGIEGYRMLLDVSESGSDSSGLIYMFIFGSEKSAFLFQGFGSKNDEATKQLLEDFLKSIRLK